MKRLVFIVEGNTEVTFINKVVIPYLSATGFTNSMHAQTIITNRKQHAKGGVNNYEYFKNDIKRTLAQGNVIITSLIDFFRLPTNFPNHTVDSSLINQMEESILSDFGNNSLLIPYIQRHELECLMFGDVGNFNLLVDTESQIELIKNIIDDYPNLEDINGGENTAPSKRLESILNYSKGADAEYIIDEIDIEILFEKCPRFKEWIDKIVNVLTKYDE